MTAVILVFLSLYENLPYIIIIIKAEPHRFLQLRWPLTAHFSTVFDETPINFVLLYRTINALTRTARHDPNTELHGCRYLQPDLNGTLIRRIAKLH